MNSARSSLARFGSISADFALVLAGLSSVAGFQNALAQPHYSITDLGVLPGQSVSVANSINDRGDIAGYSGYSSAFTATTAVLWRNGAMVNLGKLTGGTFSTATAVNSLGVAVGDGDTGNFRPQSWVTTPTGLYNFFPNNGGNTHAIAINDAGVIGGYYTKSLSGNVNSWRGSLWTPDAKDPRKFKQVDLPILPGLDPKAPGTTALPMTFNPSGQAAGYAVNDVIGQHGCFWQNNAAHTIVDLGTLPGDGSSIAWGINGLGQVVGESHPAFSSRPVVWNNDATHTATELAVLPGDNYGTATAINNLGQVLGTSALGQPGTWNIGPSRTVLWRDGGVFELQTLLDPATGTGWTIVTAAAINNVGQIVGMGVHNGQHRAFVLNPLP